MPKQLYPDRFLSHVGEPARRCRRAAQDGKGQGRPRHRVGEIFPSGLVPQAAVNDKKLYPVYMKCVELDIPMCINGGIVGPRMPSWPQHVEHFDEVCYDFPELKIVMMHGAEPWTALAVKLMLKWPGLHYMTSAFAPEALPEGHHQLRQHTRRRQDHVLRLLPGRAHPRAPVPRHAERAVQGRGVAEVPPRKRAPRLQDPRPNPPLAGRRLAVDGANEAFGEFFERGRVWWRDRSSRSR